ncbi:unnamed protein product [Symbiodinium sp. CCMP2592]|nr:unnamed protein product [Symbiodinium sp. CCMP2592]
MAAVSILTSAAAFDKQCERVGLAADWIAAMKASGITTLGKLSYAVSLPGTQPTADEMDSFTATLRPGARVNLGDSSAMKQLIFEAQTMTVAELRATMQSGEEVSRKLPASERSMRIEDQKQRLKGLPLEGPLSVAHCVYDKLANMRENDELKYLSPGECITRDAELCCEKPPKALQLDANKMGIVVKDEEALATMSVDSDLQLYQAMMRRALAMDLVGLASYETVQKWNERLFRIMSQDPPPEFQKVSRAQVLRADRQCFLELARTCNGNLKPDARGVLPLDKEFEKLEYNQSVPPLAAAQVATGMQPRKFPLAPVPEFKRFVQIAVPQCPPLDSKNRLLSTLRVQDTVVPAGSKLVPPLSRLAADRVEGEGLICNQVHRTSQAGASLAEHNPDASDASSGVNQAAPPPCGSAGALPSSSGLVGAACDSVHPSGDTDMSPCMQTDGRAAPPSCGSPAFPSSPSGVGGAAPLALSPTCSGSLLCATECEAEMLASNLGARVDASSLVSIFETLPAEVPARGVDDAREKAWTAGAYSQNKLCGLRKHTRAFPRVVSAAVRYLRTCFPDACFATIAFYSNVCTPMHRDANNLEGTLNYVAPLTSFKDGGIWVQDVEGNHSRMTPCGQSTGRVLQVCEGPVHFDAHRFHCTLPWLGSRIVLIGFTPRNLSSLKQSDTRLLLDLGFPLPGHSPPILPAIAAPQVDRADNPQVELAEARDREMCTLTFGVYHTESEFVRAAVKAGHPKAMVDSLPAHLESCIDLVSKAPPSAIVERRKQWLDKWTARAAEIGVRPDPIWEVEDSHMREVLRSKRLQLLDEIIASEGYEDVSLASDIRSGFDLVGTSPVSNVLPGKVSPASLHPDDVSASDVDRGWLVGPYGWDDLPDGYVVSHRFPLWQHDKLRPIDDYSRSGVNACVTTLEQPTVDTADVAAAMFAKLCEGLGKAKRPSWIKGRSFDLTAAYRQLCVSTASRKFAVIAVYNPHTGKTCLFTQICLPFGSRASVNGFIRCSRCIQWLATRCLLVPTTSYYDDFIVASPDCLADNTGSTMELLFQLLGWVFDTVGPKADTFSRDVSALGLHFDLSESGGGVVTVDNTEKRKRDIHALVSDVLAKGELSYKGGMELRGKLAFANSQVMGKAGHYALKHVSTPVHAYPFMPKLSAATTDALSFLMARILEGQPRRIHKPLGLPWFVYTDASFEPDYTGGLGGVLISPSGSVVGWFSLLLESTDIRPLLPLKAETGIGELEAIAVVLAFQLWEEHLKSTECVAYLDNEGARCSLIKGCSSSWSITRICHIFAKTCESHTVLPWLARVPSCSNVADYPSRGRDCSMLPRNRASTEPCVRALFDSLVQSIITLS